MTNVELIEKIKAELKEVGLSSSTVLHDAYENLLILEQQINWTDSDVKQFAVETPDFLKSRVEAIMARNSSKSIETSTLKVPDFLKNTVVTKEFLDKYTTTEELSKDALEKVQESEKDTEASQTPAKDIDVPLLLDAINRNSPVVAPKYEKPVVIVNVELLNKVLEIKRENAFKDAKSNEDLAKQEEESAI